MDPDPSFLDPDSGKKVRPGSETLNVLGSTALCLGGKYLIRRIPMSVSPPPP